MASPLAGVGPPRTERVRGWYHREDPGREKYRKLFSAREDQSLYTRVGLKDGFLRDRTAASSRIMVLPINCEIVHA